MKNLDVNNENIETEELRVPAESETEKETSVESIKVSDKEEAAELPESEVQTESVSESAEISENKDVVIVPESNTVAEKTVQPKEKQETLEENTAESSVSDAAKLSPPPDIEEPVFPTLEVPEPVFDFRNNISMFGYSQQGESHKKKGSPCQDRSNVRFIGNDENTLILAAVADGVGSCALSHFGSDCAVGASLDYLQKQLQKELNQSEKFELSKELMRKLLKEAMNTAVESVRKKADEMEQYEFSYQSTLTIAVYDGEHLYFAHAGDDGIVVLLDNGKYAMATSRHKGEEASSVYPLQSISTHQFGMANGSVVGFVLATDGVLDAFVKPEAEQNRVYYPFIQPVFDTEPTSKEEVKEICDAWYNYMAGESYRRSVVDDLSFVCVVNHSAKKTATPPVFDIDEWNKKSMEYAQKRNEALYGNQSQSKKQDEVNQPDPQQNVGQNQVDSTTQNAASSPSETTQNNFPNQAGSVDQNNHPYQNNAVYQSNTVYPSDTPKQSQYPNYSTSPNTVSQNGSAYQGGSTNQNRGYINDNPQRNGYTDYINSQSDPRNDFERFSGTNIAQAIGKGMTTIGEMAVEQGEKMISAGRKIQENANNGNQKPQS